jgi:hypothetical protein
MAHICSIRPIFDDGWLGAVGDEPGFWAITFHTTLNFLYQ